mmetsp:Transcript_8127/g.11630  ORF Transcript_8127/g.11630 Transcript_8127/m.11630 type:complete len:626 (+) Transcript_8127:147-2024(+)
MIEYSNGAYNLNLLLRVSGSPLYKSIIPSLIGVVIYILIHLIWRESDPMDDLNHPYAVGVLVSSVSFLIIFRANYGYQRYWEACGAIHHFMSKWQDAVQHTGVFHMQCKHYDSIKPPNYFDHPDLNKLNLKRDRDRGDLHEDHDDWGEDVSRKDISKARRITMSINLVDDADKREFVSDIQKRQSISFDSSQLTGAAYDNPAVSTIDKNGEMTHLFGKPRLDGGWGTLFKDDPRLRKTATYYKIGDETEGFASTRGGRTPSLFLQELAHLASLCCAVALATLRNDIEGAESPLDTYHPGEPWPEADPTKLPRSQSDTNEYASRQGYIRGLQYWLGMDRTPEMRTKYNASRPLLVIGGVSENEIAFLQRAKGPSAKVTLAWNWLSEFIMREHLAGSLGNIGPPIVSRIIQFLSDGMIFYNHARKIMYIPFPFPHAQLSAFFVLVMVVAVPFMMDQYTNEVWLGAILTFLVIACLAGLHEVARELENPFRNVPNDLPLCTLQAMFNESLITMFAGYHPDHYWDADDFTKPPKKPEQPVVIDTNKGTNGIEMKVSNLSSWPASPPPQSTLETNQTISRMEEKINKQSAEIEELRHLVEKKLRNDENMVDDMISDLQKDVHTIEQTLSS